MVHCKRIWMKEGWNMAITNEETQHVASLAKLSFAKEELPVITNQLGKILDMVALLETVDTTNIPLTFSVTESVNVLRDDIPEVGTSRKELFKNAPDEKDGYIRVPAIMDNGEAGA